MDPVVHHPILCPGCRMEADADPRKCPQVIHCKWCGTDWNERVA